MPKFHKDNRVYVDSIASIAQGINDLVNRLVKTKIRFGKRKLNKTRTLNGYYLWLLRQSDELQDEIIGGEMISLKAHHDATDDLPIEKASVAPAVSEKRHTYAASPPTVVDIDSKSQDALPRGKRAPQRTR